MASAAEMALLFKVDGAAGVDKALKGVLSGLQGARAEANKGGGMFSGIMGGLGTLGLAASGLGVVKSAVGALAAPMMDSIKAAEGLGDAMARASAVFGERNSVADWAVEVANGLGMTKEAYIASTAAAGDLLNSLGIQGHALEDMSAGLTELAPKLAAFTGKDSTAAMDALTKGVGGATRGLKEMGIVIPEIPKGLSEAAKATFIYDEILKQSADAVGAWSGNSGDVETSMQRVTAAMQDAKATIGDALLPIIAPLAERLADLAETISGYLTPAFGILKATFTGEWAEGGNASLDKMREIAGPLADVILHVGYAASDLADAFGHLMDGDPQGFWDMLGNGVYSAVEAFGSLTGIDISGIIDALFGGGRDSGEGLWVDMGKWIVDLKDKLLVLWDRAKEAWAGVMAAVDAAKPYVVDAIGLMRDAAVILKDEWGKARDQAATIWANIQQYVKDAQPQIDEALALLRTAGEDLSKAWNELQDDARDVWAQIQEFVHGAQPNIQQDMRTMGEDGDTLGGKWRGLAAESASAWASIKESVSAFGPVVDDVIHNIAGPALDDLKLMWAELKITAAAYWAEISAVVGAKIKELSDWYHRHADEIKLVFTGAYMALSGIIKTAWALIVGIIRGFMALMRGDMDGPNGVKAIGERAFNGMKDGIVRILGGLTAIIGGILAGIAKDIGGKAATIGQSIVDGIWGAILGGKGKVAEAGAAIGNAAAAGTKEAVKSFSPSRVFAEIGEWIIDGFVQGIDRNTQRAIETAGKMASGVAGVTRSIIDTFTALNSSAARQGTEGLADRFRSMVAAMTPFRAMLAEIGHTLTVPLKGSTTAVRDIERAAQMFGNVANAVKSVVDAVSGISATVTTGPAGQLVSMVQSVLPTREQVNTLVDRATDFLQGARRIVENIGHPDQYMDMILLSDIVKAMADSLKAVSDVDLSKTVEVTSLQMLKARNMMSRMIGIFSDPGGLFDIFTRLGEEARKNVAASAKDFADMLGGLASALKVAGGFTEKLDFETVNLEGMGFKVRAALASLVAIFSDRGGIFDAFTRLGKDARENVAASAKAFAELIGSLVGIVKSTEIGALAPSLEVSATALRDVLNTLRNLKKSVLDPMREQLRMTTEQLEAATKDFQAMNAWFASIAAVVKTAVVGEIKAGVEVSATSLRDALNALRNLEKSVISDIREQLRMTVEQLEAATKDFQAMANWFGAIASVLKVSQVGDIKAGVEISATGLQDTLNALRNLEKAVIGKIREQLRMTSLELEAAAADFKAMSGYFSAIAGVLKTTEIGKIEPSLEISATALQAVLLTIQNLNKSVLAPLRAQLLGMGDLDAMAKDFKTLADFIGSIAGILKAVAELPAARSIPQLTAEIVDRMLEPIRLLAPAFASLAPLIDRAANDALASMGPAMDAMQKVFGTIETVIASPFFGAGRRARSSSSMDVFKKRITESIKQAVSTLVDAMNQVTIPADLAAKFAPLEAAANALRAAFEALQGIKLPAGLPAILTAAGLLAGFAGGGSGGGVGASGAGTGGSEDTAGAIWRGIAASLDGWKGDAGCGAPIMKQIAASIDGWKGDISCGGPIMKQIAASIDGWKGDISCGDPIMKSIGADLQGWKGDAGCAKPIMAAISRDLAAFSGGSSTGGTGTNSSGSPFGAMSFGTAMLNAQTVQLRGPVQIGMNATLAIGGGRTLTATLVDALITDTASFDKLIQAEDRRRAQT